MRCPMDSWLPVRQAGAMPSLPLPVRVAAGLAASAAGQARRLPDQLIGLPITLASQALQLSMRVQQQITELAIRGDEALDSLHPAEEQPSWATFDEDEPPAPARPVSAWDRAVEHSERSGAVSPALPDYDDLTLPQVRGKLRRLTVAELAELLEHERAHAQRPEFLRMLSNRLERVRSEQ